MSSPGVKAVAPGLSGQIDSGVVPRLLRGAHAGGMTGSLRLVDGTRKCAIRFAKGHIVRADATARELRLGEVMVARGLLTSAGLARATAIVIEERRPLGEVLKELHLIDHDLLEEALVLHACEVLAHVLSWRRGAHAFEASAPDSFFEDTDYPLRMTTGDMLLEAVSLLEPIESVRYALGDMDRVLLPAADARLRFQHVNLSPTDGFVLSRVDGTLTAREVIAVTPLPAEAVERSLLALLCTGAVEDVARAGTKPVSRSMEALRQEILAAYAGRAARNHFEVLGVSTAATPSELKAAYFELAKRLHPDVHHKPELADLVDQLHAVFARLNEAYDVLSNARARAAYQARFEPQVAARRADATSAQATRTEAGPPSPPPPSAEELFQRGKDCFDGGRYWEAVALLGEAIRFAEGDLRVRARVLLAQAYLKSPGHVKNAEQQLHAALQDCPAHTDAFFLLGVLYRQAGLNARATAMFRKVLELKPGHRRAIAELDSLTREP